MVNRVPFPRKDADGLLAECHRRCSICHRFCGIKMELDHINPDKEENRDSIENAIPVCFECHAEIHLYNDSHPRGRKYHPEELLIHKEQWLSICSRTPEVLIDAPRIGDAGPLQALVEELEFNQEVTKREIGCQFQTIQFERCIHEGIYSLIEDSIKNVLKIIYIDIYSANSYISSVIHKKPLIDEHGQLSNRAQDFIRKVNARIPNCLDMIHSFLRTEE